MELQPCPWHEMQGDIETYEADPFNAAHVFCTVCGARGPMGDTVEEAVEKWNGSVCRCWDASDAVSLLAALDDMVTLKKKG